MRQIAKNLLTLFTGEAMSHILVFFLTIWLARKLSDEGFGRLAFVQTIFVYFSILTDLGLTTFGAREIARNPGKAGMYITNIFAIRAVISIVLCSLVSIGVSASSMSTEMKFLFFGFSLTLLPLALNPNFAFQGLEQMHGMVLQRIAMNLVYLVPVLLFIHVRADLWKVPFFRVAAEVLSVIFALLLLKRVYSHFSVHSISPKKWKAFVSESIVMAASVIVIRIYYSFDVLMLGLIDKPQTVGWYNAAFKVVLLLVTGAGLVQTAFGPRFAKEVDRSETLKTTVTRFALILCFLACTSTGVIFLCSDKIITLLYGSAYGNASAALQILAFSTLFVFLDTVFMAPLLFGGRQKQYLITVTAGAAMNIVLNSILIPLYSFKGAAFATLVSNFFIAVLGAFYYIRYFERGRETPVVLYSTSGFAITLISVWIMSRDCLSAAILFCFLFSSVFVLLFRRELKSGLHR